MEILLNTNCYSQNKVLLASKPDDTTHEKSALISRNHFVSFGDVTV